MMGILFSKKSKVWVPDHRKLEDLLDDGQRWKATVDMTGWQIQNGLTEKVAEEMINAKGTVEVNLSFNGLGDDECEALEHVLKQSKTIKRLILDNNHIHKEGAIALARALTPENGKDDPALEVLGLRNNSIGAQGAAAIAQVLTCNKTLKKVDLYWNDIGNEGLVAICMNLRPDFPKDFVLDIRYNGFDVRDPSVDWKEIRNRLAKSNLVCEEVKGHPVLLGFPEDIPG